MEDHNVATLATEEQSSVTLRPFTLSDLDDYYVWASDDQVTWFVPWDTYTSKADLICFIRDVAIPHPYFRAICVNGRPVGGLSVTPGEGTAERRGQLGYVLARAWWGRGIAATAVRQAVVEAFGVLPRLLRVEALADVENGRSVRVLEKVGFKKEGVLRQYFTMKGRTVDTVIYSVLGSDLGRQQ